MERWWYYMHDTKIATELFTTFTLKFRSICATLNARELTLMGKIERLKKKHKKQVREKA